MKFRAIQISLVLILVFVVATAGVLARPATHTDDVRTQKVERTIPADPSVTVSICVMSGSISVQGWDKNEVSARSSDAAQIELRQKDGAAQSDKAMKVEVFVVDKSRRATRSRRTVRRIAISSCLFRGLLRCMCKLVTAT